MPQLYTVHVPFIDDMGSVSPFVATACQSESARENALWHLNSMRNHDGLRRLKNLPPGTRLHRIEGDSLITSHD